LGAAAAARAAARSPADAAAAARGRQTHRQRAAAPRRTPVPATLPVHSERARARARAWERQPRHTALTLRSPPHQALESSELVTTDSRLCGRRTDAEHNRAPGAAPHPPRTRRPVRPRIHPPRPGPRLRAPARERASERASEQMGGRACRAEGQAHTADKRRWEGRAGLGASRCRGPRRPLMSDPVSNGTRTRAPTPHGRRIGWRRERESLPARAVIRRSPQGA
jgi:hypothetical protein